MAKRKVSEGSDEQIVIQEPAAPSAPFWEQNPKIILYGLGGIAALVLGWWLYKTQIVAPKQKEAVAAMWQAEAQFTRDSFQLALENPGGGFDGFLSIIDKYSGTAAGNTAKMYASICYLNMGDFANASKYMDEYSPEGDVLPAVKYGVLGDCYSENKEFDKALDMYEKASNATKVDVVAAYYLKKLGMLNEYNGKKEEAKKAYERLRQDFPNQQSQDWREIEKYIFRAGGAG
jgi:tetratricopeptide (TPR) repeat protein